MPTAAKGGIGLVLENLSAQGLVSLLAPTSVAATMSLTNQPSGSTGMRFLIWIYGNASGTFTLTGTDINGNAQTEGPITVPASVPGQPSFVSKFEYLTKKVWKTLGASGLATTGLTSGTIVVQGVQASKFLIPGTLKIKRKWNKISPNEHRLLLDRDTQSIQGENQTTIEEFSQVLYPENSLWLAYMMVGSAPTVTTLPASPTSLLASTPIGTLSLTTQPTFPGMKLILTVTGSSAVGTVVISNGTDQYGNTGQGETITANGNGSNGNGTYYSTLVYSAIAASGITCTGLTSGSLAITGVFGWKYVFNPSTVDTLYSAALEFYSGVETDALPFAMLNEGSFEYGVENKELKFVGKGIAQDKLIIGDRTSSPMSDNRMVALGQPTDLGMAGWTGLCYLDATAGAVPTTQFGDVLDGKFDFKNPLKPGYTLTNNQLYNRVTRGKRETTFDVHLDLTNVLQIEAYRQNIVQYMTFAFYGTPIGGGNFKTWQFTFPFQYEQLDVLSTPEMERVEAQATGRAKYDSGLGASYLLTIINQTPPTYTS